jgi:hypothetical protein
MSVEATAVVEIKQSPLRMLGLIAIGVVLTALCVGIAFHLFPDLHANLYQEFMAYAGVVFFGLCTIIGLWRLLSVSGPVVTITPDGIRDTRVAAEMIPWSAITGISTWQYRGQKIMVLAADPATEAGLTLTRIARWSRGANRALGADGLCIAVAGLSIKYDALLQTCMAHVQNRRT